MISRFTEVRLNKSLATLTVQGQTDPRLAAGSELDVAIIAVADASKRAEPKISNPLADPWVGKASNTTLDPFAPEEKVFVVGAARSPAGEVFLWAEMQPIKPHDGR